MTKEKANRNEVVGMFLTYCRKTLVNARTDVLRERKRRRNREVLFCDLRRSELESLADWQDVPERETVFDAAGKPIGVTDKDLADALENSAQRSRQSSCSPILPDGRIGVSVRTWGSRAPRCRTVAPVRSPVLRTF